MAIIKLTGGIDGKPLYINIKHIASLWIDENVTKISLVFGFVKYVVKETPEEILALIKEAENDR